MMSRENLNLTCAIKKRGETKDLRNRVRLSTIDFSSFVVTSRFLYNGGEVGM